jgi:tetratricopeptide (TPR) repeat protein
MTYCNLGEVAFIEGQWAEARDHFARALALVPPASDAHCTVSGFLETVRLVAGEAHADARLEAILEAGPRDYEAEIWPRWALAERALVQGRPEEAARYAQPLLDRFDGQTVALDVLRAVVAWAALEAGDLERAGRLVEHAVSRARATHFDLVLLDALRVQALVAVRRARWDEAVAALDEALARARPMPYPYAEAKALFVYGQVYRARSEPQQARACYQAAHALLRRLGEHLYRAQVEQALQ